MQQTFPSFVLQYNFQLFMLPPQTKSKLNELAQRFAAHLKLFKSSNPVIMLGQLKLDRVDQKVNKQAVKLNSRQINNENKEIKLQGPKKKYEKRKPAITYRSYTVEFKRKLIQKIKELNQKYPSVGLSRIIRQKARQLSIHPKNIFRWYNTKEIKKKEGGRKAQYPQMEERLAEFIINNPNMKRKHILRQAKLIMQDLKAEGRQHFNFSKGWYERFRQRLVRNRIIPGKLRRKLQVKDEYSMNESDAFEFSGTAKKQEQCEEQFLKYECKEENNIEIQNLNESQFTESDSSEDDFLSSEQDWEDSVSNQWQQFMKQEENNSEHTHMINDQLVLRYQQCFNIDRTIAKKEELLEKEKVMQKVKILKQEKLQKAKVQNYQDQEKHYKKQSIKRQDLEGKTDQSKGSSMQYIERLVDSKGSQSKQSISIFASEDQEQDNDSGQKLTMKKEPLKKEPLKKEPLKKEPVKKGPVKKEDA